MSKLVATAALFLAMTAPSAAASLFIEVFDGATLVSSTSSSSGAAAISAFNADFSDINVAATGVPIVGNADLSTVTLNVKSATPGTHVLTIDVFQTGVSAPAGSHLESTFSTNDLIGDPGPTIERTFFNGTSTSLGTLLASHTFPAGDIVDSAGPFSNIITTALFADAHQYVVTFTAPGQSSNDTVQLSSAIPEPSTWAMLMSGFAYVAFIRFRRRNVNQIG